MTLLLVFFFGAIITSFACSLWESVLLSVTPSYVARARAEGRATARLLDEFKLDIDRPLAAILTLNTIAHTVGAIGVGAQASRLFGTGGFDVAGVIIDFEAIVAAVTTLAILVLSEIIPKTLGANYWKLLAPSTARSIKVLIVALWPLVWMSQAITRFLKRDKSQPVFSHAEFLAMTEIGRMEGQLEESEARVIRNLLSFQRIRAREIMTPRTVVVGGERTRTIEEFLRDTPDPGYSRLPVYDGTVDTVTGVVYRDELLATVAQGGGHRVLGELEHEALFVPDSTRVTHLLRQLLTERQHLAIVVDEYGVTAGVVTIEDILETLLGMEILDEKDAVADLQGLARERWKDRQRQLAEKARGPQETGPA
jgi:CBS domain containing-hemolysin-like protein